MTKSELITVIANQQPHLLQRDVELAVNNIIDGISAALANGTRVEIRGFGGFSTIHRGPRIGRNPKTGEAIEVPKRRILNFKPGLDMRKKVNHSRVVYQIIKDI